MSRLYHPHICFEYKNVNAVQIFYQNILLYLKKIFRRYICRAFKQENINKHY